MRWYRVIVLSFMCFVGWSVSWTSICAAKSASSTLLKGLQQLGELKKALVSIKVNVARAAYAPQGISFVSGVIVNLKRGWILTTNDVGRGGVLATYEVTFAGGQKLKANLLYKSAQKNFAILVYDPKKLFSDVSQISKFAHRVSLDEEVMLLGRESEKELIQIGHISSKYENDFLFSQQNLRISLNAPGAVVGGVALNDQGELIGPVMAAENSFAMILWGDVVEEALKNLHRGKIPPCYIVPDCSIFNSSLADAVRYEAFPEAKLKEFIEHYPDAFARGLVVRAARKRSPFQVGDVIWAVEGQLVGPSIHTWDRLLARTQGNSVSVEVIRRGRMIKVPVKPLNINPYVIQKMLDFGGALFYESDYFINKLYGVPLGALIVSQARPGSPFSEFLPLPFGSRLLYFSRILLMDGFICKKLKELETLLPQLLKKTNFSVIYESFNPVAMGGYLVNSRPQFQLFVDFTIAVTPPEALIWSDITHEWKSEVISDSTS
jgi:hypothetical protein